MTTLATIRTYDELNAALRKRADELNVSRETLNAVAGLQSGYAEKLLAPVPIRTLSRVSFGAMLGALGLKLLVVEDAESLARIEKQISRRKRRVDTNDTIPTIKRKKRRGYLRGCSEWGRLMRARSLALQSPEKRSRLARRAIRARWKKRRDTQLTP